MVQFLSINFFFLDFFNFCWVFQKFPFLLSPCICITPDMIRLIKWGGGDAYSMQRRVEKNIYTDSWLENLKGDRLGELEIDGRMMLKLVMEE